MGERVDKLRIRDTKLLNKNFGIENEINLKYDVLIPENILIYLQKILLGLSQEI